jgi:hypothetical protein
MMNTRTEQSQITNQQVVNQEPNNAQQLGQNSGIVPNTAAASLATDGMAIGDRIVSHTTNNMADVQSILNDGIRLQSHPENLYGAQAFYVAQGGFSIHEVEGNHTIAFRSSASTRIFDVEASEVPFASGSGFAQTVRDNGFDAIRYEGTHRMPNGGYSYNLAIVQNPQNLTPIGVYPTPPEQHGSTLPFGVNPIGRASAISMPTIRTIQAAGIAGTAYAGYQAANAVANSNQPIVEAAHQTALFGAAIQGGLIGAVQAMPVATRVGAAFPPAAPYTVPATIAAGAILGGVRAATAIDIAWQTASHVTPANVAATHNATSAQQTQTANTNNTASMLTDMGFLQTVANRVASNATSNSIIQNSIASSQSLNAVANNATPAQQTQTANTSSTISMLTGMGFSQAVANRVANNAASNSIIQSSIASSQSLNNARSDFQSTIASNTNNVNLSSFSAASRPSITYTSMMDRQVALANSGFMFSSFHEPEPEVTSNHSAFFDRSGGGGNGGKHCDPRSGNCNSQRNCGNSSSGKCESKLR